MSEAGREDRGAVRIGPHRIGDRCLVVAELGTGHGGSLLKARELVDAAADCGVDAVKLQLVIADEILHPLTGEVALPGGPTSLYERFRTLERKPAFYADIKAHAEKRGLLFLCTAFGVGSARILRSLGCAALKIASPELNHVPLLREVAAYGLPLILSTGVSTLADVERAVDISGPKTVLLHCITAYPAPEEEYNLRLLPNLSRIFSRPVGVSDHSSDPVLVPAAAAAMGACIVEKHFTLEKTGDGLDDPIAVTPPELSRTVEKVGLAESGREALLEGLAAEYGGERLEAVLGTGVKALAPSERGNYGRSNRSVHALHDLKAGEILTQSNIAALRTEKNLDPGLEPRWLDVILGRRTSRSVKSGAGITWDDLLR